MISVGFCREMARYNAWQNKSLVAAASSLTHAERRADRGAFWGSIEATLNHVLWGDTLWMSRFAGWKKPKAAVAGGTNMTGDWIQFRAARGDADQRIQRWTDEMTDGDLQGDLAWFSKIIGANLQRPKWICIQHFFNHQTHHRGQIHAMLTAAGAAPEDTDLVFMPDI